MLETSNFERKRFDILILGCKIMVPVAIFKSIFYKGVNSGTKQYQNGRKRGCDRKGLTQQNKKRENTQV